MGRNEELPPDHLVIPRTKLAAVADLQPGQFVGYSVASLDSPLVPALRHLIAPVHPP